MKNRRISMPFWCVSNPVGDPFGPAVMDRMKKKARATVITEEATFI